MVDANAGTLQLNGILELLIEANARCREAKRHGTGSDAYLVEMKRLVQEMHAGIARLCDAGYEVLIPFSLYEDAALIRRITAVTPGGLGLVYADRFDTAWNHVCFPHEADRGGIQVRERTG